VKTIVKICLCYKSKDACVIKKIECIQINFLWGGSEEVKENMLDELGEGL